jgi:PAS domain S-box-containing protein
MADQPPSNRPGSTDDAEYFRDIADNIPHILWMFDETGTQLVYVSKAFERISGLPVETVYTDPDSWRQALHPDDRARVEQALGGDRLAEHNLEFRVRRPDGEIRWIWARGVPLRTTRGKPPRIVGIAEDITAFKQAEAGLEHSASLLRATVDATFDGVLALNHDRRITIFDRRFVEMWRIPDFVAIDLASRRFPWPEIVDQLRDTEPFLKGMDEADEKPQTDTLDRIVALDVFVILIVAVADPTNPSRATAASSGMLDPSR